MTFESFSKKFDANNRLARIDKMLQDVKVLICDNHPVYRLGLKYFLSQFPKYKVAFETGNGLEAIESVKMLHPDIIVLDVNLPMQHSLQVIRKILLNNKDAKIISLSDFTSADQVIQTINAGVKGILFKSDTQEQIISAFEQVIKGGQYFCKGAIDILINQCTEANTGNDVNQIIYSKRELEIIALICQEKTAKEIGASIFISEKTVDFHRKKIIQKMKVKNIVGLVVFAIKNKLVDINDLK